MLTTGRNTGSGGVRYTYCLDRTKGRIAYVLVGLLLLFLAVCMGVYGLELLGEDKSGWDYMEYIKLAFGWLACAGFAAFGVWECCASLRDALQPGKSALAASIRSQLPHPEEAPHWQELFAMVDSDLAAGANWFGKVGIGREWVLGDAASYLPNIRGVFRRCEIRPRTGSGSGRRIIQLWIVDCRQGTQVTDLMDDQDLDAAIQCLRLRVPAAVFGNYNDCLAMTGCSQDEWDRRELDFRLRQAKLAERAAPTPAAPGEGWQPVPVPVRTAPDREEPQQGEPYLNITDGMGVSRKYRRFSRRDAELAAQGVGDGTYRGAILWLPPHLIMLDAGTKEDARTTIQISLPLKGAFRTFREKTTGRQAAEWFLGCLEGKLPEGFDRWKEVTKEWERRMEKLEKQEKKLVGNKKDKK